MIKGKKIRIISLLLSLVFMLSSINMTFAQEAAPERTELPTTFGMPSTFPNIGEHPRVYMRKQNFEDIKLNMRIDEGKYAVKELNKLLAQDTDGVLSDKISSLGSNMDYNIYATVEAYAFDYALNGNQINGIKAVKAMNNIIKTFKYNQKIGMSRAEKSTVIGLSAMVYDWCYPLMTAEDKRLFTENVENLAKTVGGDASWPLKKVFAVHGHNNETLILRDLLSFAIACYDEYPDFYHHVGGYVMNGLVEPKNWWYRSQSFHQGSGYFLRFGSELSSQLLFLRMNGTKLYSEDMGQVPYMLFYYNRPDGRMIPEGDNDGDSIKKIPTFVRGDMAHLLYASSMWEDGYLKGEYERNSKGYNYFAYMNKKSSWPLITPTNFLIINNPHVKPLPKGGLPKTRMFGSPNGLMVARTGLNVGVDSNDVIAWAKIGETYVGNHAHQDSGSFQIYYKGPLAWDNGRYEAFGSDHNAHYSRESIAHNSLLIYDPDEVMISETSLPVPKNSGGQQRRGPSTETMEQLTGPDCHMGDVLGMEAGEDPINPEYSYISGDIAPAYSDKVSEVRRSMLFMPTGREDKPAIFVVMDKVISSNPSFKKTFLLHSLQEPIVEGNVTTIKRDSNGYNGKLINQTLYPQNPQITRVGDFGKQFWVVDENIPPKKGNYAKYDSNTSNEHGWGHVEISPSVPAKEDYFLNVIYVSDADNETPVDRADLIETKELLGARIFDKVTLFGKNRERVNMDMTFTVPGEGSVAVSVAGIAKGEWKITGADGSTQTKIATEEGGIIYFEGTAGTYTMQLTNSEAVRP